jgi:hypothetical protein
MKMPTLIAAIAISGVTASASLSEPTSVFYTKTFHLSAPCDGNDIVHRVSINGGTAGEPWQIFPWEDFPIMIVYVQIVKFAGGPHVWLMAGNNVVADAMLFVSADRMEANATAPSGTGKPFPGSSDATPMTYLDLHGACSGEGALGVFYTIGYTKR